MPLPIITTLAERELGRMLAIAQESNIRARQADAARRLLILSENWKHVVLAHIGTVYKTDDVKIAISKRVKGTFNVLQQLTRKICVAYKVPPVRTLKGAPESAQLAWSNLMREAKVATRAKDWERYAFALNVAIVVPVVRDDRMGRGKRLDYETILPHCAEVYTDVSDPMGAPAAVAYSIKDGSDFTDRPLRSVVLDANAWHYYDDKGNRVYSVAHGAGVFPGVVFRLEHPVDDWWCSHRGSGVIDATVEVAHLAARMDWIRHGQDRKKELLTGEKVNDQPFQIAGAEGPVQLSVNPNQVKYQVEDLVTSIETHIEHIRFYLHQAAESYGVPSSLIDFDPSASNYGNVTAIASASQQAALADMRTNHIEFHRDAERELAWKTALVLRGANHPAARALSPDIVAETFEITYPELTFVEDPMARASVAEKRIAIGLSSVYREYLLEHPGITPEQAREEVKQIALEEGELNLFFIHHNIPRDPKLRRQTPAQLQGRDGGEASGEARREDADDDDSDEPGRASDDDFDAE